MECLSPPLFWRRKRGRRNINPAINSPRSNDHREHFIKLSLILLDFSTFIWSKSQLTFEIWLCLLLSEISCQPVVSLCETAVDSNRSQTHRDFLKWAIVEQLRFRRKSTSANPAEKPFRNDSLHFFFSWANHLPSPPPWIINWSPTVSPLTNECGGAFWQFSELYVLQLYSTVISRITLAFYLFFLEKIGVSMARPASRKRWAVKWVSLFCRETWEDGFLCRSHRKKRGNPSMERQFFPVARILHVFVEKKGKIPPWEVAEAATVALSKARRGILRTPFPKAKRCQD